MNFPTWRVKTFGPSKKDDDIAAWLSSFEALRLRVTDIKYFPEGAFCKMMIRVQPNVTGPYIKES